MSHSLIELFRTSCGATAPLELNVSGPSWAGSERRVFELPFVLVGRDESSGLRLDDAAISHRHVYLQQLGERIFCVDLGSRTGIRWRGEPRPGGWLCPNRGIDLGPFTLAFPRAAQGGACPAGEGSKDWDPLHDRVNESQLLPRITVELGDKVLSQFRLNRVLALVGSAPACRVRLRDAGVSRYHCSLVMTPERIWLIDLLSRSGTYLNGQSVRWTLVQEGDRVQIGPYVLRCRYRTLSTESAPPLRSEFGAATPVQLAKEASQSLRQSFSDPGCLNPDKQVVSALSSSPPGFPPVLGGLAVPSGNVPTQALFLPHPEKDWTEIPGLAPVQEAELDLECARERETDIIVRQLADSRAECDRLCEQARGLEIKVAEVSSLQTRLGASERELDVLRAERDQLQTEVQALRDRSVSDTAEREKVQQQLEQIQQQFNEERKTVQTISSRLEQESVAHEEVRAALTARNAEHTAALQRLRETQDELTRSLNEVPGLRAELNQARECQRDAEALRQQLADAQAKLDRSCARALELEDQISSADHLRDRLRIVDAEAERLREQLQAGEAQVTNLQSRLEAAEACAREFEAARGERDRWQNEARTLQDRMASEMTERKQLDRLIAHLHAMQEERDRVQAEQQASRQSAEQAWTRVSDLERALTDEAAAHERAVAEACNRWTSERQTRDMELEKLRVQLRTAESQVAELEVMRVQCAQLREQVRGLEFQAAEVVTLQSRLEAAETDARELQVVCVERDRWQTEARKLREQIASDLIEREQGRQRLESLQHQLVAECERVRTTNMRLDQESAVLQEVRANLAVKNAEFDTAMQRLQKTQDELARSQDKTRSLQAELDQARECQREVEALRQELAETQAKLDQSCAHVREVEDQVSSAERRLTIVDAEAGRFRELLRIGETQVTSLRSRLESAEASNRELEAIRGERDQWQSEARTLRERMASEMTERKHLDCLAADLHAVQEEHDRLQVEQQASRQSAEQAWARVSDLERALEDEASAHERTIAEVCGRLKVERQTLESRLEQERQAHDEANQAAIREVQDQAASEREDLQQRLKGAEAQLVRERGLFQEQTEQIRQQVAVLQVERDQFAARLAQAELTLRAAEEPSRDTSEHAAELEHRKQPAARDRVIVGIRDIQVGQSEQAVRTQGQGEPDAGATRTVEPALALDTPAVLTNEKEPSIPSDAPQAVATPATGEHRVEDIHGWLLKLSGEERPGLWRRVLNFLAKK